MQDSVLSETPWPAPSLCGGSLDSRAIFLKTKLFFLNPAEARFTFSASITRGVTTQPAIPDRRAYVKRKQIPLMQGATIWRTTVLEPIGPKACFSELRRLNSWPPKCVVLGNRHHVRGTSGALVTVRKARYFFIQEPQNLSCCDAVNWGNPPSSSTGAPHGRRNPQSLREMPFGTV